MSESKMTPGPWQLCSDSIYYDKDGPKHRRIATIAIYGAPDLEAQANSKAIAALPELVEALQSIVSRGPHVVPEISGNRFKHAHQLAIEALKKAGAL